MLVITIPLGAEEGEQPITSVGDDQPTRLVPRDDVNALVALRMILEEATARARDASDAGRRVAVILLDGCAEAAIGLGLASFDESPHDRDTLDTLHQRLVEALRASGVLAADGRLSGWPNVRRLRRVRNDAQHHQIPPDHSSLVTWARSVEQLASHIVRLTFDLDLMSIVATDAIEERRVQEHFEAAELHAERREVREAVMALGRAFNEAMRLWRQQRRSARALTASGGHDELGLRRFVEEQTSHLDDLLVVAPFAVDLGEYVWWTRLQSDVRDERVEILDTDVDRARAWVFGWITRWEAFAARYTSREKLEGSEPIPPASRGVSGAPEIDDERRPEVVRSAGRERVFVRIPVRLGTGSAESAREWSSQVFQASRSWGSPSRPLWTQLESDGWLTLHLDALPVSPDELMNQVRALFASTETLVAESRVEERARTDRIDRCHREANEVVADIAKLGGLDAEPACRALEIRIDDDRERLTALFGRTFHRRVLDAYFLGGGKQRDTPALPHGTMHGIGVEIDLADRDHLAEDVASVVASVRTIVDDVVAAERADDDALSAFKRHLTRLTQVGPDSEPAPEEGSP